LIEKLKFQNFSSMKYLYMCTCHSDQEQLVLVPVAKAGTNAPLKDAAQIVSVETPTAEFTMTAEKEHIVCPPVPSMQAQKQDDGTQSLSGKMHSPKKLSWQLTQCA
jgi:hypothetical protein